MQFMECHSHLTEEKVREFMKLSKLITLLRLKGLSGALLRKKKKKVHLAVLLCAVCLFKMNVLVLLFAVYRFVLGL